jgi:hypothetical protein
MTCHLYRHFDADGVLLYVGISLRPIIRLSQHKASSWFDLIKKVEIQQCADREEALAMETLAIQSESPKYNKAKLLKNRIQNDIDQKNIECITATFLSAIYEVGDEIIQHDGYAFDIILSRSDHDNVLNIIRKALIRVSRTARKSRMKTIGLERASIDFFKEIRRTARQILGGVEFNCRVNIRISIPPADEENGKLLASKIMKTWEEISTIARNELSDEGINLYQHGISEAFQHERND